MLNSRTRFIFFAILFFYFPQNIPAQHFTAAVETLNTDGIKTAVERVKKSAIISINKLYHSRKKNAQDVFETGRLAIEEKKWGKARKYFEKVLKRDPLNLGAHYYLGICLREIGNTKGEFLHDLFFVKDWRKSQQHFQFVLERDSLYQDVLYQYARLLAHQKKFPAAIMQGQTQIRLRPDLVAPYIGLFHFYRSFIYHTGTNKAMRWLESQSWPLAHYFKGEILRRQGEFAQADSIFRSLLSDSSSEMPEPPIHLSRAKVLYAEYRPQEAETCYWQAVNSINSPPAAALVFDDLKYIVTDKELEIYQSLPSPAQKIAFFYNFWAARNPNTASAYNARLAEHYRRLRYTEEHYEFYGDRSYLNNPDKLHYLDFPPSYTLNHEFNDAGLIYLRQGPADEWELSAGEQDVQATQMQSWHYLKSPDNPEMIFHFAVDAGGIGNNWRLTPNISSHQLLFSQADWDADNFYLLNEPNRGKRYALELEIAETNRDYVLQGLSTDRHTDFVYDVERFMTPADSLFHIGDLANAKILYRKALKLYKNLLRAKSGLGKIAILESQWREGDKYFKDILRREPDNFAAHYYHGICLREIGVPRSAIARNSAWRKAEDNFQWIMARDSLYEDVVYQLALLQRYRGHYTRAINLAYTQIRLRPDLVKPQVGLYYLYWSLLKEEKPARAIAWLKKQSWDQAQYFLGEYFRRKQNWQAADSVFQKMLARDCTMSRQPIYLSLARIAYAQKKPNQAEALIKRALAEVHSPLEADLIFEDIKYLVSDQELVAYQLLASYPEKVDFLRAFWSRRDPVPSAPHNARLAEHYRRLQYAEEHY
ncbi:MAG: GWxTD domain-containing protein, partial [bacterium]